MKPIPSNVVRALEIEVPDFVRAIQAIESIGIELTLDAFEGEPELFYNCVWYASHHGKNVTVLANRPGHPTIVSS